MAVWTNQKHVELAEYLGCDLAQVEAAFDMLTDFKLWAAARSEDGTARAEKAELGKIADELDTVIRRIEACPPSVVEQIDRQGLPTPIKLTELRDHFLLQADVAAHFTHAEGYPATKGRKERARIIADCVANLFVATGRPIGKGTSQSDGEPSSPYGKAVKKALEIYGIDANWRQPAIAAAERARQNTN